MSNERFEIIHSESKRLPKEILNPTQRLDYLIVKDNVTGVLYLQNITSFQNPALTPLLDADGKPLVDEQTK